MARKKSKLDLKTELKLAQAELKLIKRSRTSDGLVSVINNAIKWAACALIAYFMLQAVLALAGKKTFADIGVNFLAEINISIGLAWTFGVIGVLYGLREKKLRKDAIERLAERNRMLEQRIDPNRSSSGLDKRGNTPPEGK